VLAQGRADQQPFFDVVRGQHAHEAVAVQHGQHRVARLLHDGEGLVQGHRFLDELAVAGHHVADGGLKPTLSHAGQQVDTV
jgi:hypothetical protein